MAKLTVIVTAYNEEKYILECLKSIENQTFRDMDLIIVNDGSTDNTLEIIQNFTKTITIPTKIISQDNQGVSIARNNALKFVDSKYIKFVDGDDYLELDALEKMINMAEKFDLPIIKTSYQTIKNNIKSKNSYNINFDKEGSIIDLSENKDWIVLENVGIGGKLFRTNCFENIEFPTFDGDFVPEDLAIMPYVYAKAGRIGVTKLSLINYRRHIGSLTNSKFRKLSAYYIDGLKSLEYLYQLFKDNGIYEKYKEQLAKLDISYRFIDILSLLFVSPNYSIDEKLEISKNLITLANLKLKEFDVDKELYVNKNAFWWPLFMALSKGILSFSTDISSEKIELQEETRRRLLKLKKED